MQPKLQVQSQKHCHPWALDVLGDPEVQHMRKVHNNAAQAWSAVQDLRCFN